MKTIVSLAISISLFSTVSLANVQVKQYNKNDGTYVSPHSRTAPDSTRQNNWSTKGNQNPYTGKMGTKNP